MIHFYQQNTEQVDAEGKNVKEWKFVTPSEYEAKKGELPEVCYATRHPIPWLIRKLDPA